MVVSFDRPAPLPLRVSEAAACVGALVALPAVRPSGSFYDLSQSWRRAYSSRHAASSYPPPIPIVLKCSGSADVRLLSYPYEQAGRIFLGLFDIVCIVSQAVGLQRRRLRAGGGRVRFPPRPAAHFLPRFHNSIT
jgi:hypothetical protein